MRLQDCASSFTKGNFTYNENDPGFKALQRCATLCNVSTFQEDSKVDKNGTPVPFKKVKVQGDGSTIEVSWVQIRACPSRLPHGEDMMFR